MKYDPVVHHRRSVRLKDYDYSKAGAYFLTICTWNKECILGGVDNEKIELSEYGKTVFEEWHQSSRIRKEMDLDEFVIMPNHIHGIVIIHDTITEQHHAVVNGKLSIENTGQTSNVGANGRSPLRMKTKSISSFMAGFKSSVTKRINQIRSTPGAPFWQRNYYEYIIRGEKELNAIREYIRYNPLRWNEDTENPNRKTKDEKNKPVGASGKLSTESPCRCST